MSHQQVRLRCTSSLTGGETLQNFRPVEDDHDFTPPCGAPWIRNEGDDAVVRRYVILSILVERLQQLFDDKPVGSLKDMLGSVRTSTTINDVTGPALFAA